MGKVLELAILGMVTTFALHAQWIEQKSGTTTDLADIALLDSTTAIAVGRDGTVLKTTNAGTLWVVLPLPGQFSHSWNAASFFDRWSGTIVGDSGHVAVTTDGGDHWSWHAIPGGRTCLSVLHDGPAAIYIGDDSGWVHRSLDTGNTWLSERISTWPIRSLFVWRGISSLGIPHYALTPYSICENDMFPVYRWKETILQAFQGLGSEAFRGEFSKGGWPGFLVGVHGDLRAAPAIARMSMSDTVWRPLNTSSLGDGTLFGVSAPSSNMAYVCGDRGMIFSSTDRGDTWFTASVPTMKRLRSICFLDEKKGFAVGDSGTILYTFNGGTTTVDEQEHNVVMGMTLSQNFPNPFNPVTTMKYTIGGNRGWGLGVSDVSLVVYDVVGREVAVLVNEKKAPGTYSVAFDGSNLASGVYFYRLLAGEFMQTKRMILIK